MTLQPILRAAAVLGVFAIVTSGLLAVTYDATEEKIAAAERAALLRSLNALIPPSLYDNDLIADAATIPPQPRLNTRAPTQVFRATRDGQVVAVAFTTVAPDGYNGDIRLLVAVRRDASLIGVRAVDHRETPGLGDGIEIDRSPWIRIFEGKSLGAPPAQRWRVRKDGGDFDQLTGATITPRAVVKAVRGALEYFGDNKEELLAGAKVGG